MAFFSEVQKWFEKNGENGGRYLQNIILAWENDDKIGFKKFINNELDIKLPSNYRLAKEYFYQSDRSADLAILHNEIPILLVEIKWNDTLIKKTEYKQSQLEDYVAHCVKNRTCHLLVLTKNSLTNDEYVEMSKLSDKGRHLYFGVLYPYLDGSSSSVAKMFFEYLQDKGIVMNDIDSAALFRFFDRFVNPNSGSGRVSSEEQLTNGPEQFSNLLNNMRLIAQEISPIFYDIRGVKRGATVDFFTLPKFSQKKNNQQLDEEEMADDEVYLYRQARTGGEIYIYAKERISNKPWTHIQYGFCFSVQPSQDHKLDVCLYAEINGGHIEDHCYCEKRGVKILKMLENSSRKSELVTLFMEKIGEVIHGAIEKRQVDQGLQKQLADVLKKEY